ncbi:MAG: preprotein translocase subunit SecE [Saprospiraceae bacterium]|nr:preprotein translocase subunit SecE [Saprospiraceae bacterium]
MNIRQYVQESLEEFRTKMTWPTWTNLQQTTGVVLLASVLLALVIFGMDTVSNQLLKLIYGVK